MKTKNIEMKKTTEETSSSCSGYVTRGALLWGPVYTTGVSGLAYAVAPDLTAYSDVLLSSVLICPSFGAAGGYLRWKYFRSPGKPVDTGESRGRRLKFSRRPIFRKAA